MGAKYLSRRCFFTFFFFLRRGEALPQLWRWVGNSELGVEGRGFGWLMGLLAWKLGRGPKLRSPEPLG